MRKLAILALAPVLAVAGCGENTGWNPNYSAMGNGSRYADYLQKREVALHGRGPVPDAIPVQLPVKAPTAADIAGTRVTQKPAVVTRRSVPAPLPAAPMGGSVAVSVDLGRYAVQESQAPGITVYTRTGGSAAAAARACAGYASADAAQRGFIAAGGPLLDPRGMDPDGDGFVCGWDPRPLRQTRL